MDKICVMRLKRHYDDVFVSCCSSIVDTIIGFYNPVITTNLFHVRTYLEVLLKMTKIVFNKNVFKTNP